MEEKTHWKNQFNYDYLGSYSLPEGKDIVLTIKEMTHKKVVGVSGKKEDCFTAYFEEDVKPMILNKTNCKAIERLYKTPFIQQWVGKSIQIGTARVNAFGEMVDALRVKNIIPNQDTRAEVRTNSMIWNNILAAMKNGYTLEQIQLRYRLSNEQIKILQQ